VTPLARPSRWRLLLSPPLDAATNMALDVALMRRARMTGEATMRVYSWEKPALSLGRNQPARGHYDESRATRDGIEIVRRPTGGRALLHHREVTYSVTAPAGDSLRASYARINALLLDALRRMGVAASLAAPATRAATPSLAPCFETPAAGEIVVDGRKLVGSAQWREDGALLQHGSLLVDDDQPLVGALTRGPLASVPAPATLRELLGRAPTPEDVHATLGEAIRALEDADLVPLDAAAEPELGRWTSEARATFIDPAWTWRR
jgi:lipoate-protein ligase A